VTLTGLATIEADPALKARWVAAHPYAAFYAGFGDFHLWRLRPVSALYVGGFARAHRLKQAELVSDAPAVWEAEAEVIAHCNGDHPDALEAIAKGAGLAGTGWRMVACDADGMDLTREGPQDGPLAPVVGRVAWPASVDSPAAVRAGLMRLAKAGRHG